jgi:hypothetical protein
MTDYAVLHKIAVNLKNKHSQRRRRQIRMQLMARGIDPRATLGSGNENGMFENRLSPRPTSQIFLKTNDPRTFLDLVVFLLAGNELQWALPTYTRQNDDEKVDTQTAERLVHGIFQQNDQRLVEKGMPRLNRAIFDSACRFGMSVVHEQAMMIDDEQTFIMEPWSPLDTYERAGINGLSQVVHDVKWNVGEIKELAESGSGWLLESLKGKDDEDDIPVYHIFEKKNGEVTESIILGAEKGILMDRSTLTNDRIPVRIRHYNGEPFPGDDGVYQSQSILEANYSMYLDHSDLLRRIEAHGKRVVNPVYDEFTLGGQPKADPNFMNPSKGANIQPYDSARGETGRRVVQIQPLDVSLQIQNNELVGFVQRGGVPYALFGNVEIELSGFAIKQLLNAALSTAGEIQEVGGMMFSDLGRWILDSYKESSDDGSILTLAGFVPTPARREYFVEDFTPDVVPEHTGIQAIIDLATPDDLLERINMIRNARPAGGNFLSLETAFETALSDIVTDSQAEINALEEEEVIALPSVRIVRARRQLIRLANKIASQDPQEAEDLRAEAAALLQQLGRGGDTQTQQGGQVTGATDQGALPRQVRQAGGAADPRNNGVTA